MENHFELFVCRLEDEISELEKRYQDQRKRLLAEVHVERETMERANDATLAIREKENEQKWQSKSIEMQKKMESLRIQHQVRKLLIVYSRNVSKDKIGELPVYCV